MRHVCENYMTHCKIVLCQKKMSMIVTTDFMCLQNFHNRNNILGHISPKIRRILDVLQDEKNKLHINQKADVL